ncbi:MULTISPECIES: DUF262 domain-containing protein [Enterococcus]|uniref:DUF262 domain-containing protein n=1 Tax=Enterococcus TaxID=1350 RepID=UPI000C763E3D|nr:DUF262 domain-containing protein [Enterococcus sp. CR-Ec1]AUJ87189.1 hypothetical protein CXM95_17775 [Enterococcus sp. CR-Ec1]
MPQLYSRNFQTVDIINEEVNKERLVVDTTYQRRKVWMPQDKVRLIETILLGYVMPEVFFWPAEIDPSTGKTITHIVDGQQRISAIIEFINDNFSLNEKYLLDKDIKSIYGNKYFTELTDDEKLKIWKYEVFVVNIDHQVSKDKIKQMFYRLNLTNYSLNSQEKLNSVESVFGDASEALSQLDFWKECRVFSASDARRMQDVRYCCSIYILANEGIVDQTGDRKITQYYTDYCNSFDEKGELRTKIEQAIDIILELLDKSTQSFLSKKAQLYTMFCVAFKMIENDVKVSKEIFEKFKLFAEAYSRFRNEYDIDFSQSNLNDINENIKKYKLASSEGINKVNNRVIRFETLYKICIESTDDIKEQLIEIAKCYRNEIDPQIVLFETLDKEDLDIVEEE